MHAKALGVYILATLAKEATDNTRFGDALLLDWRGALVKRRVPIFLSSKGKYSTP